MRGRCVCLLHSKCCMDLCVLQETLLPHSGTQVSLAGFQGSNYPLPFTKAPTSSKHLQQASLQAADSCLCAIRTCLSRRKLCTRTVGLQ